MGGDFIDFWDETHNSGKIVNKISKKKKKLFKGFALFGSALVVKDALTGNPGKRKLQWLQWCNKS